MEAVEADAGAVGERLFSFVGIEFVVLMLLPPTAFRKETFIIFERGRSTKWQRVTEERKREREREREREEREKRVGDVTTDLARCNLCEQYGQYIQEYFGEVMQKKMLLVRSNRYINR